MMRSCLPVEDEAEIEFALDRHRLLDVEAVDELALRAGLLGDEAAAEQLLGGVARPPSRSRQSMMPPALPRAPEWTCAFTIQASPPISVAR